MKVSIGFHLIFNRSEKRDVDILNALNRQGLTVDGNQFELVDRLDKERDLLRVWTEGTLEAFHEAADMIMAINTGGPVMFVATELTDLEWKYAENALSGFDIDHHDDAAADNEVFAYCENADHIRTLSNALT